MRALAYLQLVDIAAVFSLYSLSHFLFSFLFSLYLFSIPASALLTPISELSHFSICGDVFNPLSYSCIYSNVILTPSLTCFMFLHSNYHCRNYIFFASVSFNFLALSLECKLHEDRSVLFTAETLRLQPDVKCIQQYSVN